MRLDDVEGRSITIPADQRALRAYAPARHAPKRGLPRSISVRVAPRQAVPFGGQLVRRSRNVGLRSLRKRCADVRRKK